MTFILTAFGFLKRVPWQVYAGIAAILLAVLYINHRENAAVKAERNKVALEAANAAIRSERAATASQIERDEANRTADDATRKDIDDAIAQNPEAARAPTGPVVQRTIDSLRNRSTANDTPASVPR